jgi:PAT family beta-lactamase induction signal transducer AmpG
MGRNQTKNPWFWIPSLYFAEGLPYVMVMTVSVIMYKRLEVSNTEIAFYTSWLYLPWVIKPFWSPFVDLFKTKRWWIVVMQLILGAGMACVAFAIPTSHFFQYTLAFFWLMAFSSATHDIAADGFYMIGLNSNQQSYFVGIRSMFYRIAMVAGQGGIVMIAGSLEAFTKDNRWAWSMAFFAAAGFYLLFFIYHRFVLPRPSVDSERAPNTHMFSEFANAFSSFFQKKQIVIAIAFFLLFRLGESQLLKMASPFLLDSRATGGLGLSTSEVGLIYGTFGVISLMIGGIIGGWVASIKGLKYWLFWMTLAINIPHLLYVYMSWAQPESKWIIASCVCVEQMGYGFGYTAFTLYMIYFAESAFKTTHFAICTGIVALGMMVPGMVSGWIEEQMGYLNFFILITLYIIPGFVLIRHLDINSEFGKRNIEPLGDVNDKQKCDSNT